MALVELGDGLGSVLTECPICRGLGEIIVKVEDYQRWRAGVLIQDAFPYVKPAGREQIKSGTHPACWREMFGAAPWESRRDRWAYRLEPVRYRVERRAWRVLKLFRRFGN